MARTQIDKSLIPSIGTLANYRRPVLTFASVTTINVDFNSLTSNKKVVLFPDGDLRINDNTTHVEYSRMNITRAAVLTGTKLGGLRSGESESTNTWYAAYAVKSQDDSATWVIVTTVTLPLVTNIATLDGYFGVNGWIYLGLIRNGDNAGATGDILNFRMVGNMTIFMNKATGGSIFGLDALTGTLLATTASAVSLTYTYTAGTGTTDIPTNITIGRITACISADTALICLGTSISERRVWLHNDAISQGNIVPLYVPVAASIVVGNQTARPFDIWLTGFMDDVLSPGMSSLV